MENLIIEAIERDLAVTPIGDVVYMWNRFVKGANIVYRPIAENLSSLVREFYADRPEDLAKAVYYGCIRDPNSYVFIERDGNIYSLDDITMLPLRYLAVVLYYNSYVKLDITIESDGVSPSFFVELPNYTSGDGNIIELVQEKLDYDAEVMGVSFGEESLNPNNWNIDIVVNYTFGK